MPRIDVIRIRRWLWLELTVNDFGEYRCPRFGRTVDQASRRTFEAGFNDAE